jgi:rhodanese-related sulfurtransferase/precorrin-6B methylase 2
MSPGSHVSPRWQQWRATVDLHEYHTRWDRLAAAGQHVHGEADFIASLGGARVLDAGCGMGRIAIELSRRRHVVAGVDLDEDLLAYARTRAPHLRWVHDDLATMQLDDRFDVVAMPGNVMIFCKPEDRRAVVHTAMQHLLPGGRLVAGFALERDPHALTAAEYHELCVDCDLHLEQRWASWDRDRFDDDSGYVVFVHRRSDRYNVHDMVFEARSSIRRYDSTELAERLRSDRPPLVVDTRTSVDRLRFGTIAGSVHVPRTVLEWHLDPASGYRHPQVQSLDQPIVVVCNGGYSSSVGAASLARLGFTDVGDLRGGVHAWLRAGLPVVAPDHSHLDAAPLRSHEEHGDRG